MSEGMLLRDTLCYGEARYVMGCDYKTQLQAVIELLGSVPNIQSLQREFQTGKQFVYTVGFAIGTKGTKDVVTLTLRILYIPNG